MEENLTITIITSITTVITASFALIQHLQLKKAKDAKENTDIQLSIYDSLLNITSVNKISQAVTEVFEKTAADRFLILVGVENRNRVDYISVIFEQHKGDNKVNAIATYHNIAIDDPYREMIAEAKIKGLIALEVDTMQESILKSIYKSEGVKYSKIRFLGEKSINKEKKVISISSMATHVNHSWSEHDKSVIKLMYDSTIIPLMNEMMFINTEKFK